MMLHMFMHDVINLILGKEFCKCPIWESLGSNQLNSDVLGARSPSSFLFIVENELKEIKDDQIEIKNVDLKKQCNN